MSALTETDILRHRFRCHHSYVQNEFNLNGAFVVLAFFENKGVGDIGLETCYCAASRTGSSKKKKKRKKNELAGCHGYLSLPRSRVRLFISGRGRRKRQSRRPDAAVNVALRSQKKSTHLAYLGV